MKPLLIDSTDSRYGGLLKWENSVSIGYKYPEESDLKGDFSNIDTFISNGPASIISQIASCDFEYYIIPLSLTNTLLDFSGIRLAQHIRLTKSLEEKRLFPIIFVSWINPMHVIKLAEAGEIITASGNYFCKPTRDAIENAISMGLLPCKQATDKIKISIHNQSNSHHSIANEWSILTLSQSLGISEKLKETTDYFEAQLYFKYLLTNFDNNVNTPRNIPQLNRTGEKKRILYIDDEYKKGWEEIFGAFFSGQSNINFKCFEPTKDFTDFETSDDLIVEIVKFVRNFDPDIVLLDLRLHDQDFEPNRAANEMTGLKILKEIKDKINPGIQIIVITASNKVWNLIELQNSGMDFFVLKNSPEINSGTQSIDHFFYQFQEVLEQAFKKSFIKGLISSLLKIKTKLSIVNEPENPEYNKLIAYLKSQINVGISMLGLINPQKSVTLDIAFLTFYNFLESFKGYYLQYDKSDYRYYLGFDKIIVHRYSYDKGLKDDGEFVAKDTYDKPSWSCFLTALFFDYFKVIKSPYQEAGSLKQLQKWRNDYIHSTKRFFDKSELTIIISICVRACDAIKE